MQFFRFLSLFIVKPIIYSGYLNISKKDLAMFEKETYQLSKQEVVELFNFGLEMENELEAYLRFEFENSENLKED